MSTILAVVDRVEAEVELELHDLVDGVVLELTQLGVFRDVNGPLLVHGYTLLGDLRRPQERAEMLGPERRPLMISGSHLERRGRAKARGGDSRGFVRDALLGASVD